jgi:uncharacterized protein YjdB
MKEKRMRSIKKTMAMFLVFVMFFSMMPTASLAKAVETIDSELISEQVVSQEVTTAEHENQVRVIVENNTYPKADGASWDGVLVDKWVTIDESSSMATAAKDAIVAAGYTQTGAESNYISEVNGLEALDGGAQSGWMVTLNDWFTNEGIGAFTVAAGNFEAGDEIRVLYTMAYGVDLGGTWGENDKTVKVIESNSGTLTPAFSSATKAYTLNVPKGTQELIITPTATNKNFQVRTSVGTTEYKRTTTIPVKNDTVITVKCGDPSWPTMNEAESVSAEVYTITVKIEGFEVEIQAVIDQINALFAVDALKLTDKAAITAARDAYDQLNDDQKALVTNLDTLTADEAKIAELIENQPPVRKADVPEKVTNYVGLGNEYSLNLATIFEDVNGKELTYKVSIDGEGAVSADVNYALTSMQTGTKDLVFVANNGKADSNDTYTVALITNVKATELTISTPEILKKRDAFDFYYYFTGSATNDKFTLTATVLPEGTNSAVKWSSSAVSQGIIIDENTGEVTVDKEKITKAEYAKFTATSVLDDSVKKICAAYIIPPMCEYKDKTGLTVTLSENGETMTSSNSLMISPSIYNNYDGGIVEWTIADESIAKLVKGGSSRKIEGLKPGKTIITATNTLLPSNAVSYVAEVIGVLVAPQDSSISTNVLAGNTLQLSAMGSSSDETFTWTSSNEAVATVDEFGMVMTLKEGGVYIYAESSAMNGEDHYKGGVLVNVVRDEEAPYFENLELTNYRTYQEWASASEGFTPSTLNYNFTATSPCTTTMSFNLKPSFDNALYEATVSYGEESYTFTKSEESKYVPVEIGENNFVLRLALRTDDKEFTDYTFDVTRPRNTVATVKAMSIAPESRALYTANDYKYLNQAEGAMFKVDPDTGEITTSAGVTANTKSYRAFVFDDLQKIDLSVVATDIGAHLRVAIADGEFKTLENNSKTDYFDLNTEGTETTVIVESCSDLTYNNNVKEGIADPFVKEDSYTVTIEKVAGSATLVTDVKIDNAEIIGSELWSPEFDSNLSSFTVYTPADTTSIDLNLEVQDGIKVYNGRSATESKIVVPSEDGTYSIPVSIRWSSATQYVLVAGEVGDQLITKTYKFSLKKSEGYVGVPDEVTDYLVIGSQYTNTAGYGMYPEVTLVGDLKSLGNFGGYITYKYDLPVKNDPQNKYGVDFIVYGNSFGGSGASEPGNVQVSQDGSTWYSLAGSDHFDDNVIWDYAMTYTKGDDGESNWSDNQGNSGTNYQYPNAENYPLFNWTEANQKSMTVTGDLLTSSATDPYGSKSAAYPAFGYADVNSNGRTIGAGAGNPYIEGHEAKGNGFDLSWAVDDEGNSVELDSISYLKVGTASNIYAGWIGEKSTEVTTVMRSIPEDVTVGTSSVTAITVNDKQVELVEGTDTYTVLYNGSVDVTVDAPEDSNVYINNVQGTSNTFETAPREGIVRVIVQQGDKEPVIKYLKLELPEQPPVRKAGIEATANAKIALGNAYTIDLSTIFEDVNDDELTYNVSIDGTESVNANVNYTLTPDNAGTYTLVFRGNDGKVDSNDTYTVSLVVKQIPEMYNSTGNYLYTTVTNPKIGSIGGEWTIMGLARSNFSVSESYYENYLANVLAEVKEKNGVLSTSKYTEYSRLVLGLTAIGYDVTNVAGYNLLEPLADSKKVANQGINGSIFALIAFDSHGYEIPVAPEGVAQTTRDGLIKAIMDDELTEGGWSLFGSTADSDVTAMAIQALAPYYNSNTQVKVMVDRALITLSSMQKDSGGFGSSESCSQVILALTALGINPTEDSQFIKDGNTVIDGLSEYYIEGGGFSHSFSGGVNSMATDQGYLALTAYERLLSEKTSFYNMNDVKIKDQEAEIDQAAAKVVIDQIAALPAVDQLVITDKADVEAARTAYDALTIKQKALVNNLDALVAAEAKIAELVDGEVTEADKVAAKIVLDQIAGLPAADQLALGNKADVVAARIAYNALTEIQKSLISNLDALVAVEAKIAELETITPPVKDEATGIEIVGLPESIEKLIIENDIDNEEIKKAAETAGLKDVSVITLQSIKPDMTPVALEEFNNDQTSYVTVTLPIPEDKQGLENYRIYHLKDNGAIEWLIPVLSEDGKSLVFKVNSFSTFGIVNATESSDPVEGETPVLTYQTHVQNIGWQEEKADSELSGTEAQSLRLEGIKINLDKKDYDLGVAYQTQIENIGWQEEKVGGVLSGTEGMSYRLEGIKIHLTGADADQFDIYYHVHAQNYGWLDWTKNGASAGTEGLSLRLEAIEITLVKKGSDAPGKTEQPFVTGNMHINYQTQIQNIGWQSLRADGTMSGTKGQSLRLEGIKINLDNAGYDVGISYQTHVQDIGWQDLRENGDMSGTEGESKRLEGIRMSLTGADAGLCDVYYQVHTQNIGWMNWAKNGESSGSEGFAYRLEGIRVVVVPKGSPAPELEVATSDEAFMSNN